MKKRNFLAVFIFTFFIMCAPILAPGFALAVDGWKGYFPTRHGGGGNLDEKRVRAFVQTALDLPCDKIFFNAAYDVGWLKAEGFRINGRIIDAMIAAALIALFIVSALVSVVTYL